MLRSFCLGGVAIGLITMGVGCAAAADGSTESASSQGQAMNLSGVSTTSGPVSTVPMPILSLGGTTTTVDGTSGAVLRDPCVAANIPTTYVMRLPDSDGAKWSPYYSDGYTLAFPTPFVTDNKGLATPYQYDPDTFEFEHMLNQIAYHEPYEYLVRNVIVSSCGYNVDLGGTQYCIKSEDLHQFFLVGFTSTASFGEVNSLVYQTPVTFEGITYSSWAAENNVEARVLKCVQVMDPPRPGSDVLRYTPYKFVFAEEHDPGSNPFIPPHP
jgi:hypothetical protein